MALSGALTAALAGLAVGVGAVYLSRRKQETAAAGDGPGKDGTDLGDLCAQIPEAGAYATIVKAGCEGLNAGAEIISNMNDQLAQAEDREKLRSDENEALNGEITIPNTVPLGHQSQTAVKPTTGSALRFANGCEPFEGAPGWTNCAPGTHDMRTHVVDGRFPRSYEKVRAAGRTPDEYRNNPESPVDWAGLLKGSVSPAYPDPATTGPFAMPDGTSVWYVRGQQVKCNAGDAPAMWNAAGQPIRDQRTSLPPCVPNGNAELLGAGGPGVPVPLPPPLEGVAGPREEINSSCVDGMPPPGFTWQCGADGVGFIRRLAVGETPQPCSPCKTTSRDYGALLAGVYE